MFDKKYILSPFFPYGKCKGCKDASCNNGIKEVKYKKDKERRKEKGVRGNSFFFSCASCHLSRMAGEPAGIACCVEVRFMLILMVILNCQ